MSAAALVLLSGTALAQTGAPELELVSVERGFGGRVFSHVDFMTVEIENTSAEDVSGEIAVRMDGRDLQTWPVEVGAQTTSVVRLQMRETQPEWVDVVVRSPRGERRAESVAVNYETAFVNSVDQRHTSVVIAGETDERARDFESFTDRNVVHVATCRQIALPESPHFYRGVSIVVLEPGDYARLTPLQRAALYDYVRLGGVLAFSGDLDLATLASLDPWQRWFANATPRQITARAGQYTALQFTGGRDVLQLPGEPAESPLLNVTRVGFGHVGHLAVSLVSPRLPGDVSGSRDFWTALVEAFPDAIYPVSLSQGRETGRHLRDGSSFVVILGYFALYLVALGPVLMLGFRKRERRRRIWPYVAIVTVLFTAGTPLVNAYLHTMPSSAIWREVIALNEHGLNSASGVLHLRSAGRQQHSISLSGERVSGFAVARDWNGIQPGAWQSPEAVVVERADLQVRLAPWSSGVQQFVGDLEPQPALDCKATLDQNTRKLRYTLFGDIEPEGGQLRLIVFSALGAGGVHTYDVRPPRNRQRGQRATIDLRAAVTGGSTLAVTHRAITPDCLIRHSAFRRSRGRERSWHGSVRKATASGLSTRTTFIFDDKSSRDVCAAGRDSFLSSRKTESCTASTNGATLCKSWIWR